MFVTLIKKEFGMTFASNKELPENIRNNLPEKAQDIWRNTFNSAFDKNKDEESAMKQAWGAVKNAGYSKDESGNWELKKAENIFKAQCEVTGVDGQLGIVFGWGMVTDIDGQPYYDLDDLHINSEVMVKATSQFMEGQRTSNDMHTSRDVGIVVHSFPLSQDIAKAMGVSSRISGWMVGVKPSKDLLEKFISGEYTGFSIEGEGELIDI
jgi:cation transport regulator